MIVRCSFARGGVFAMTALAACLHACGGAGSSVVGADVPSTPPTMQGPPSGDASTMGSARACTDSSQCAGACPSGTSMCTCATTPMGMICVPGCSTTADCPMGGAQSLVCETRMRLCVPSGDGGAAPGDGGGPDAMMPPGDGGPMPPDAMMPTGDGGAMMPRVCTSSADCTGACPGTATGCGCGTTPMGTRCVPTCTSSAQCPMGMNGTTLMCRDGFCAP